MTAQLPLRWPAPAHLRFQDFDPEGNAGTLATLQAMAVPGAAAMSLLLVGPAGAGKTHLAIATATAAREHGRSAAYLALSRWTDFDADALAALSAHDVIVIDEIERCAGRRNAEVAVFDLYNRCVDQGRALVMAAREAPARLPLQLPDLVSRLNAAAAHTVRPLPEEGRRRLLRERAQARGFELDDTVIDFLFRRHRRDLPALLDLVDRLDRESLSRQRRVTVPLVKAVLDVEASPQVDPDPAG